MGVGLEVVEDADAPAFAEEKISDVRADETRPSGDERALLVSSHDGYANGSAEAAAVTRRPYRLRR
jgi:hypothetical protein